MLSPPCKKRVSKKLTFEDLIKLRSDDDTYVAHVYLVAAKNECMPLLDCAPVKVVLKGYRIRRASASARMLCPFPEYSPLFQNTILIVSEDPDGYCSISEGPDDYRMVSGCRDKYRILI